MLAVYCVTIVSDEEAMRNSAQKTAPARLSRGISNVEMPANDLDYDSEDIEGVINYDRADTPKEGEKGEFDSNLPVVGDPRSVTSLTSIYATRFARRRSQGILQEST